MSPRASLLIAFIVSLVLHWLLLATVPSWLTTVAEGPSTTLRIRLVSAQGESKVAEAAPANQGASPELEPKPRKKTRPAKTKPPVPAKHDRASATVALPTEPVEPPHETMASESGANAFPGPTGKAGERNLPDPVAESTGHVAEAGDSAVAGSESIPLQAPGQATEVVKFPRTGSIKYVIKMGNGFMVGEARHQWTVDNDHYRIEAVTETTGLAGLIRSIRMETSSEGHIIRGILTPDFFKVVKNGTETGENARFDWAASQVRIGKDGQVFPLTTGAQDLLSFHYYYVGGTAPRSNTAVQVATGKKFERFPLEIIGEETLEIPAGRFQALHLRSPGDRVTEIWIALDLLSLPVRVRYTEKNGDVFDETATHIQIAEDH